jgi:predicted AlkP superfamily phosphohydrolase/phosphomutase
VLALLQFDSVSLPVLERLLGEGRLPVLADLRARGRWQALEAPDADIAAAVYHTLYSGVEAGEHGLYHTFQWRPEQQRSRFMDSQPKPETVWERVTRSGGRSAIIDPFVNWQPREHSGVAVSGWQFSNRIILQPWSHPRGELKRLSTLYGSPRLLEETLGTPSVDRLLRLSRRLVAAPARGADAAVEALRREELDLLWVTFAPAHFAGHWLLDPARLFEGKLNDERGRELSQTLAAVYEATDRAIGRVVEALPAGTDLVVLSPTGMGPNTSRADLLPGMVKAVLAGGKTTSEVRGNALWGIRGALPISARNAFSRAMPSALNRALVSRLYFQGTDWTQTKAFAVPGETQGLVRLNLRGRERDGIIDSADAAGLLDEIAAGLATFTDPDGTPAVVSCVRPQERWPGGARVDQLPDLLVRWTKTVADRIHSLSSPELGTVSRPGVGTGWPGNHCDEAWALLVPGSSHVRESVQPPRVVDIVATVCELTGADASGLEGQPLLERAG